MAIDGHEWFTSNGIAADFSIDMCREAESEDPQARNDISAIKVFVPAAYSRVVDRAIQIWGAAGVSNDLPLAGM